MYVTRAGLKRGQTGQLPRASTKTVKNYYLRKHKKILFEQIICEK